MTALQRFPITREEIDKLVTAFYARVRQHPSLGPIFHGAIGTDAAAWQSHEAKISAFWRNAILIDRDYQGNPMQVHMANPDIMPQHFEDWLNLFDATARDILEPETAAAISDLAHRIGRGLRFGIEGMRRDPKLPPKLT